LKISTPAACEPVFHRFHSSIGILVVALAILTLLRLVNMTRAELIKLHDHLVTHYNNHGAEEAREQISALEELLLASIALNASAVSLPRR
jgi:hypothetical protein